MRFLLLCSAALLATVMLAAACNTVDPAECWPNTSGGLGGSGTIPIGAGVGTGSGDFASPRFGPLGYGAPANPCVEGDGTAQPGGPPAPMAGGATSTGAGGGAPFAGIDPETLSTEALGASGLAYYLDGALTFAGVDTSDPAATTTFLTEITPWAEKDVDSWLMTVDPSAIPTASVNPKPECIAEPYTCPYSTTCMSGTYGSELPHICWVVDCGVAKCSLCPEWVPDFLKSLVWKSWCSYVCTTRDASSKIVARGAVGINSNGGRFPAHNAWCVSP